MSLSYHYIINIQLFQNLCPLVCIINLASLGSCCFCCCLIQFHSGLPSHHSSVMESKSFRFSHKKEHIANVFKTHNGCLAAHRIQLSVSRTFVHNILVLVNLTDMINFQLILLQSSSEVTQSSWHYQFINIMQ